MGYAADSSAQQKAMKTPTIAANTNARNDPLPATTSATGAMMNTDEAGVTPDSVMKTLPRIPMERLNCWLYRPPAAGSGCDAGLSSASL